ncbi:T9SS type A sorting domain-containing protein [Flavobacterium sp. J27]|uniref:T9SS type A sorting domain-containing protein n=1 Tax=Flavobacterium sp. J27 TaxID=2060419 RepID=UPI00103083C3|nr:T9SS type A sorting domain-containing protein [Flavobacterium sp. J27]
MKKQLTSFLFLLLISKTIFATNYYIDPVNGNNSYNGLTEVTAKQTLTWFSYNTTFLQPGDTVFLMNGTYTASGFAILALRASGTTTNPITFKNYPGHTPILQMNDFQWHAIHLGEGIHDIIIDGLRIRGNAATIDLTDALNQPASCGNPSGSPDPKFNGNGITIDGRTNDALVHHIIVRNCEIYECCGGGIAALQADYLTYENNHIYDNSWYTIYGASGISNLNSVNYDNHTEQNYSMIIRNNVLHGNELYIPWIGPCVIYDGNGIIIDSENNATISKPAYSGKTLIENNVVHHNGGRGIHAYHSNGIDIINNTCYMNGRSPVISDGEITVQGATNVKVYNNIMYARETERANFLDAASTGFSFGNNLIFNAINNQISYTNSTDKVGLDPLFINPNLYNGNFKVETTSPAINGGNNLIFATTDYDGISRPQGSSSDIGAFEAASALSNSTFEESLNTVIIYPNPTTDLVTVHYTLIQNSNVTINLYDYLGKEVISIYNEKQNKGKQEIEIKTNYLQKGIYLLKINNGLQTLVKKIIVN